MRIDFAQAMRCGCEQPYQNLTMDGTTISCQTANLCIINLVCTCRGKLVTANLCAAHPCDKRMRTAAARLCACAVEQGRAYWSADLDELTGALEQLDLACLAELCVRPRVPSPAAG
jgi:hypothetical protein